MRCGAPYGAITCTACAPGHGERLNAEDFAFAAARAACSYEGVAKLAIHAYKDLDERRLDALLAELLCAAIRPDSPTGSKDELRYGDWSRWADALVAIPPNPAHLRHRGYDHMGRVAKLCAQALGLSLLEPLVSHRARDQRALTAQERSRNRAGSISLAASTAALPQRVLLLDDVMTTGATCSQAAEVLLANGASDVRVACVARVW